MFQGKNFNIEIYVNDQSMNINDNIFDYFEINEMFDENVYTANLILKDEFKVLSNYPIKKGTKIKIELETYVNGEIENSEYNFEVFDLKNIKGNVTMMLVPYFFNVLFSNKYEKKYEGTFTDIISDISQNILEITDTDIDNSLIESDVYYMFNQTYMSFISKNIKYLKDPVSGLSNFCFFINKDNKLICKSLNTILQSKDNNPIDALSSPNMKNTKLEDRTYGIQSTGGYAVRGYYFDWENGEMKSYDYTVGDMNDKLKNSTSLPNKLTDYYNEDNIEPIHLQMDPIGNDYFIKEDNIKCSLENTIQRKNYFNIFLNFSALGSIKYSPLEVLKINFINNTQDGLNTSLSGNYLIHSIKHLFQKDFDYMSICRIVTPLYNKED